MAVVYKRPVSVRPARQHVAGSSNPRRIPPTASGRAADMARSMHAASPAFHPPVWCPPLDHVSYFAALQARGEKTEQYERLTEEFYSRYPKPEPKTDTAQSKIDYAPMDELNERYYSKAQVPPVPVVARAMRKAGYSDERIEQYVKWNKRMEETYEQRTEALEKIFAKWPSASKGPVKKKVIKAVKKNL